MCDVHTIEDSRVSSSPHKAPAQFNKVMLQATQGREARLRAPSTVDMPQGIHVYSTDSNGSKAARINASHVERIGNNIHPEQHVPMRGHYLMTTAFVVWHRTYLAKLHVAHNSQPTLAPPLLSRLLHSFPMSKYKIKLTAGRVVNSSALPVPPKHPSRRTIGF